MATFKKIPLASLEEETCQAMNRFIQIFGVRMLTEAYTLHTRPLTNNFHTKGKTLCIEGEFAGHDWKITTNGAYVYNALAKICAPEHPENLGAELCHAAFEIMLDKKLPTEIVIKTVQLNAESSTNSLKRADKISSRPKQDLSEKNALGSAAVTLPLAVCRIKDSETTQTDQQKNEKIAIPFWLTIAREFPLEECARLWPRMPITPNSLHATADILVGKTHITARDYQRLKPGDLILLGTSPKLTLFHEPEQHSATLQRPARSGMQGYNYPTRRRETNPEPEEGSHRSEPLLGEPRV